MNPTDEMIPPRPYLLRAMYEWLVDNRLTPQLIVNNNDPDLDLPCEPTKSGYIVLNISPNATCDLRMDNTYVNFGARFKGKHHEVFVPIRAVSAIIARENGKGMSFPSDESFADLPPSPKASRTQSKRPILKIIK